MNRVENNLLNGFKNMAFIGSVTAGTMAGLLLSLVDTQPLVESLTGCSMAQFKEMFGSIQNCSPDFKITALAITGGNVSAHLTAGAYLGEGLYSRLERKIINAEPLVSGRDRLTMTNMALQLPRLKVF